MGELFGCYFLFTNSLADRNLWSLFNKKYQNLVPDNPGGGKLDPGNYDNIEDREDGALSSGDKTALAVQLKEQMGIDNILKEEHEIVDYIFSKLGSKY
jgi:hypothetical protein